MVGSSLTQSERLYWGSLLRVAFVALVGLSSALVAVQGGGSLVEIAIVAAAGTGFGAFLLYYMLWMDIDWAGQRRHR